MYRNKYRIGLTALGLSLLALLLASVPACLMYERILKNEPTCQDEHALFSFDLDSCEKRRICSTEAEQCVAERRYLNWRLRLCNLSMVLSAVASISTALYSWRKEQAKELCLLSIFVSLVAISWQYVNMVFSVSMALLLFIILSAQLN